MPSRCHLAAGYHRQVAQVPGFLQLQARSGWFGDGIVVGLGTGGLRYLMI